MDKKVNYGIDAPGVIRNLLIIGLGLDVLLYFVPSFKVGNTVFDLSFSYITGSIFCIGEGLLMIRYAKVGKFKQRDKILGMHEWKGNEKVLDIGTGRGLLMIGAAKKLSTGKSIGIDIWSKEDLSNNSKANAEANAAAEGVSDKVEVQNQDITKTSFADGEFDVIVSNLCIHNIGSKEGRKNACAEIARILKSGGTAIISDFKNITEYSNNFKSLGLSVEKYGRNYLNTFPPLGILKISKN